MTEGSYAVSASGTGTGSISGLSGRNQALIPGNEASVTIEVHLAPAATATGRFLKADGITPIAGGQITLKRNGQAIAYSSSSSDPADPGRFRLEYLPLGDFSVEGYDPVTERRGIGAGRLSTNSETVTTDVVVTRAARSKGSSSTTAAPRRSPVLRSASRSASRSAASPASVSPQSPDLTAAFSTAASRSGASPSPPTTRRTDCAARQPGPFHMRTKPSPPR